MKKSAKTRQRILELTAPLFNTQGYEGTSLADLCNATHLTKGALYGNFQNKEQLALAAFQYAVQKVKEKVVSGIENQKSNKAKLLSLLDFYANYVFNPPVDGGCPLLNTAIEADDHHKTMRRVVAKELESTVSFMADLIDKGKKSQEFKPDVKSREYAFLFFCAIEGAIMVARVSPTDEAMRLVVKQCKYLIDQISN
jgi:AcrR family transcriptional regulator